MGNMLGVWGLCPQRMVQMHSLVRDSGEVGHEPGVKDHPSYKLLKTEIGGFPKFGGEVTIPQKVRESAYRTLLEAPLQRHVDTRPLHRQST